MSPQIYPNPSDESDNLRDLLDEDIPKQPIFRTVTPPASVEETPEEAPPTAEVDHPPTTAKPLYHGATSDPIFGFLLALALSIGLIPLLPENADFRYTVVWGALAGVGVITWLLGNNERVGAEQLENVAWGVGFGFLLGAPLFLFGEGIMRRASPLLFPDMGVGTVLAYILFVMPLAETLFYRGLLQQYRDFWIVGLWSALWNIVVFFPVMWGDILEAPIVAVVIAVAIIMMNLMYSYVRQRNGLAAAWLCQIITNVWVIFLPLL